MATTECIYSGGGGNFFYVDVPANPTPESGNKLTFSCSFTPTNVVMVCSHSNSGIVDIVLEDREGTQYITFTSVGYRAQMSPSDTGYCHVKSITNGVEFYNFIGSGTSGWLTSGGYIMAWK